ncbi:MAG TPA: hypothetical protein VKB53_11355 [Gammaproteobacteria bacterium]|nr:hypothetical protein [Gammaproteobacteria bacterium]
MSVALAFAILLSAVSWAAAAERSWPGAPPDCWKEERIIHNSEFADLWKTNTAFKKLPVGEIKPGVYSPNKGYYFIVENGRPDGAVIIFAEKPYLIRIEFSELFGLANVKWINEKLLFIRPWWGRIAATDLIYDVEAERVIHSDGVIDAYQAFLQYRESCPMNGCECIKKKSE